MNKLHLLVLSAALVLTGVCFAAYTKQNTRVMRVQADTTFNDAGTATAVNMDVFLQTRLLVNDADPTDKVGERQLTKVSFDLLDPTLASTDITAAGKTVTYPQLAALIRKAALDRANAQGID